MVADTKKVQTMINRTALAMQKVREGVSEMEEVKALFQTANPDVTGTPLDGNITAVNTALTSLKAESDKDIWSTMIAAIVPSHRGEAL